MKIAIIGGTAGAHFLAQKLLEYSNVEQVFHFEPNYSVSANNRYVPLFSGKLSFEESKEFILNIPYKHKVDLIIPMPNQYQVWREFYYTMKASGAALLMPTHDIGMLELSKIAGKKFLQEAGVPTPNHRPIKKDDLFKEFFDIPRPWVLKFDQDWRAGLQTVIITDDNYQEEYKKLVETGSKRNLDQLGDWKDQHFAIEEYVEGVAEFSYHALCNNTGWTYIGSARDYKKRYEGDIGFNTAGMGSYSPVDVDSVVHSYVDKILTLAKSKGLDYIGFMYLGIMIDNTGKPVVLEINTRPGDPEIQSIIPLIKNNLPDLLYAAATNQKLPQIEFSDQAAVSLRVVHKNYELGPKPGRITPDLWPVTGDVYLGHNQPADLLCSVITAVGDTRQQAADKIYSFLENKNMGDYTYRTDIGYHE